MRTLVLAVCLIGVLAGCAPKEQVLGERPDAGWLPVGGMRDARDGQLITTSGRMVEKCPVAGCWFYVEDKTGKVRVDSKNAGFVVVDVPVGTWVTVGGKLRKPKEKDAELRIDATGIKY